jgi:type IV pilus assembly protein PilY1
MRSKKLSISFTACFFSFMISFSAFGDDLEIYLGTSNSEVTYKPNVLFIMDTSGSMSNKDGTNESRMQRVQNALRNSLGSATNINAGLMRFSDFGGPVLFPVRDIDDPVTPELVVPVVSSNDDATEINSVMNNNSNILTLSQDTNTVYTGLRYQDINIPRGATITSAAIRFASSGINTATTDFIIKGEATGDSQEFESTNNNISGRDQTAAQIVWDANNAWPNFEETILSPDITNIIQEIVNRSDWCGGNSLAIILETANMIAGSDRRSFSNDEGNSRSPQLLISYDDTTATGCVRDRFVYQVDQQDENAEERSNGYQSTGSELTFHESSNSFIGVRFKNINLPRGANVTNAYLEFTAYQNGTSSGARMTIRGVDQNDPSDFSPYYRYMLRDKPKTSATVDWTNIEPWYRNGVYQSPPVTSIVQEIIDRSGWNANNEMILVMSNFNSAKRGAYTYNGKPSGATRLVIEFEGNATPGSSSTVRQHLISKVDELSASGLTPIVDTLYEAALYYGGRDVDYGRERGQGSVSSSVRRATRVSYRTSYVGADSVKPFGCTADNLSSSACQNEYIPVGARYISPVQDLQCQTNNHIVLLSDGSANNNHSVSKIQAMLNKNCTGSGGEKCGLDLVKNISDTGDSVIDARVITHTIGFAANSTANNFLNQLALQSGGGFYRAENSEELLTAFETILRQVKDVNSTFVSPGVAVNQLNRLSHRDELYFALFKPSEGTLWPGNLKKYKISGDRVLDKNGLDAVDDASGFFSENSHSFWSPLADGNDVREGGAASRLDLVRNIYTFDNTPGTIFSTANRLHEDNSNISAANMAVDQLPDPAGLREQVIKWSRGVDVKDDDGDGSFTDVRNAMGDPIHSQPVIVNYSDNDSAIFVATNHGFLHSIDAEDGSENFAIIPNELLGNLYEFYRDGSTFNHQYGLDGDLVLRQVGDRIYLYLGMRRGGNNYYVFDVTEKANPKLVFNIDGGNGDYLNMGQTWSRPILTKIKIGGTTKNVMIVGGGYDETQDTKTVRGADSVGNSVYIIDAENGSLIWSASNADANLVIPEMQYSIPARISAIDRDNDGLADHLYVADTGGQIFRLDIYNGESLSDLVEGGLIASMSGTAEEDNRRFYYGPDVSEILLGDEQYYAVAIGSGFRAGPLNTTIEDEFYMIKDTGVFLKDSNNKYKRPSTPYTASSLYDATEHMLTSADEAEREIANTAFADKNGWYIRLTEGGEKVLASPLILDFNVFFTTYLPASASSSLCAPPTGNSRAYLVSLFNGNAVTDLNNDSEETKDDRYAQLAQTGIAPDTKILIENIVKPVVCLGAECVSAVIELDADGNEVACGTQFECLAQNIYGRFQRVQKDVWKTEIEKP